MIRYCGLSGGHSRDSNYEAHLTFGLIHVSIRNVDGLKGGGFAPAHSTHDNVMATLFNRAGTQRLAGILACPVGQGYLPAHCVWPGDFLSGRRGAKERIRQRCRRKSQVR